jgi:hypothetical protein
MRDVLRWTLEDGTGEALASGGPMTVSVRAGTVQEVGTAEFLAPQVAAPARLTLRVCLGETHGAWPFWVFPRPAAAWPHALVPPNVIVSRRLTDELLGRVRGGWRAVVTQDGQGRLPTQHVPFWREGLPLLYEHPILAGLPHDGYADEAWEALTTDHAIDPAQLQAALHPVADYALVVRRLDCREFTVTDYLSVVRMGTGILVLTTLAFDRAFSPEWGRERSPFAAWLWNAMLEWAAGA